MRIVALLNAKLLVMAIAGVVLAGGAAAVVAATPVGQQIFYATSHAARVTKTPDADSKARRVRVPLAQGFLTRSIWQPNTR